MPRGKPAAQKEETPMETFSFEDESTEEEVVEAPQGIVRRFITYYVDGETGLGCSESLVGPDTAEFAQAKQELMNSLSETGAKPNPRDQVNWGKGGSSAPASSSNGSSNGSSGDAEVFCDDCSSQIKGFSNKQNGQWVPAQILANASRRDRGGVYCYNCQKRHPKKVA
jgi:hypothetical protein